MLAANQNGSAKGSHGQEDSLQQQSGQSVALQAHQQQRPAAQQQAATSLSTGKADCCT